MIDPLYEEALGEKQSRARATIVDATYHQELGQIALLVSLPDGSRRGVVLSKSSFLFRNKDYRSVPVEESDREMAKTAELFRRRRGTTINLDAYPHQIEGESR